MSDSSASQHMTLIYSILEDIQSLDKPLHITVPTGDVVVVKKGPLNLNNMMKLHNVLFIPQFSCNWI